MPDNLLSRILRRRFWTAWVLIFVLLAQPVCGPGLVRAAPPADPPQSDFPHALALPPWFTATETLVHTDVPALVGAPLPAWFNAASLPCYQLSTPSLSKSAAVITATLGQVITYTVVYTIPGATAPTNFTLQDTVPGDPDLTFNTAPGSYSGPTALTPETPSASPITPTFSNSDHTATWLLGELSNASGNPYVYQITYQATVNGGDWGDLATNDAHLYYDSSDVSALSTITIYRPDMYSRLSIVASNGTWGNDPGGGDVDDLTRGDVLTFTLYITNADPGHSDRWPYLSPAYDLRFYFELPNFLRYEGPLGTTPNPTQTVQGSGWTHLDWQGSPELESLGPHETLAYVFTSTVNMTVTANRDERPSHRVYYRYLPDGASEPNVRRNGVHLRSRTLAMVKSATTDALLVGQQVTYTIRFTMPEGVSIMTPIYIQDDLYDGLDWERSLGATPHFSATPNVSRPGNDTIIRWDWNHDDITQAGVFTCSFVAVLSSTLKSGAPVPWDQIRNRARLYWRDAYDTLRNADSSAYVQVIRPHIPIEKDVWTGTGWGNELFLASGGQEVRFRIRDIRNEENDTSIAYEVAISDSLPAGFTFQDAAPPSYYTTTVNGQTVITWSAYVSLTPGSELPMHYITATAPMTLTPDPGDPFKNWAYVFYSDCPGSPPDDNLYVNTNDAEVEVDNMVQVTKYADPSGDAVRIGDAVTFTIVAQIASGSYLHAPFFADQRDDRGLRAGYHFISGTFAIVGASATPVTIPQGTQEIVSWILPALFTNTTGAPHYVTSTFQARFTGIDLDGDPVYASDWSHYRDRQNGQNEVRFYWYLEQEQLNQRYRNDDVDGGIGVIQPLLVDPNYPPDKTLVGGGPTVQSGDLLTYSLTMYNTGRALAYDVIISDQLPAGVEFVTYTISMFNQWAGETYTPTFSVAPSAGDTGLIGWTVNEVNRSDNDDDKPTQLILTYTVQVTDGVGAGATLNNSAWISDYSSLPGDQPYERHYDYLSGVGDTCSAAPVSVPEAEISKSAGVTEVAIGNLVVFTVTVPDPALGATLYNVTVTDTMPPPSPAGPLHVLTATAPGATYLYVTSDTVAVDYASIPAYSQATIVITARAPVTAVGGLVENVAEIAWRDAASGGNLHTAFADPVAVTIVAPDVEVSKNAPGAVPPGYPLLYTIVYTNSGTADAHNVRLTDTLPFSVTYVHSHTSRQITPVVGFPNPLAWELGTLQQDEGGTVWLTVTVWPTTPLGSSLVNSVTIGASSAGDNPVNNQDTVTTVVGGAVLGIAKMATPDPVRAGGLVLYTLVVTNSSGQMTQNLAITDRMPLNTTFVGASPGGSLVGNIVTWNPADIGVGEQAVVTFAVQTDSPLVSGTQIVNDAYVAMADNALPSSSAPVIVTIHDAQLAVTKIAWPDPVQAGGLLHYTLTVSNLGDVEAVGVVVTDRMPLSTTFAGASPGGSLVGDVVTWNPADIGVGEQAVVTFAVQTDSPLVSGTQIVNDAYVAMADNALPVSSAPVIVTIYNAQLEVTKIVWPDPVQAGDLLHYTLTVRNVGDIEAMGVVVTDRLPLGTTFDSASSGGSPLGDVVTWNPTDVGVGGQIELTFAVQVDSPMVSGTLIVNDEYGALADNALPSPSPAPVTVIVHSQPVLFIQKTAAGAVDPGDNLVYTILYQNTGNAVAHNVRITESYAPDVMFIGAAPSPGVGDNVWQVGPLTPTTEHTIVVTVQVGASVADGVFLTNTVMIDSDETDLLSDTISTRVGDYLLYMPIILKNYVSPPPIGINLVVQNIKVGPALPTVGQATCITVTLYNSGTNAVTGDFWVDLYIDPTTTPTIGVIWSDIAPYGKAWLVHEDIPGGGTLVIHTNQPDDADNPDEVYSNWPGWFVEPGERVLYVQVDSFDSPLGQVQEDDESDNVYGPLAVTVAPSSMLLLPFPVQWQERR